MKYKNLLFLVFYFKSVSGKYPTPRWLTICKSCNISSWYKNTTSNIYITLSSLKVNCSFNFHTIILNYHLYHIFYLFTSLTSVIYNVKITFI